VRSGWLVKALVVVVVAKCATPFVVHRSCSSQYPIVLITSIDHAQHVKRFISDPLIHVSMLSLVIETMTARSRRKMHEHMPLQRPMSRGKTGGKTADIRMDAENVVYRCYEYFLWRRKIAKYM
jgi:hypothetical protein